MIGVIHTTSDAIGTGYVNGIYTHKIVIKNVPALEVFNTMSAQPIIPNVSKFLIVVTDKENTTNVRHIISTVVNVGEYHVSGTLSTKSDIIQILSLDVSYDDGTQNNSVDFVPQISAYGSALKLSFKLSACDKEMNTSIIEYLNRKYAVVNYFGHTYHRVRTVVCRKYIDLNKLQCSKVPDIQAFIVGYDLYMVNDAFSSKPLENRDVEILSKLGMREYAAVQANETITSDIVNKIMDEVERMS